MRNISILWNDFVVNVTRFHFTFKTTGLVWGGGAGHFWQMVTAITIWLRANWTILSRLYEKKRPCAKRLVCCVLRFARSNYRGGKMAKEMTTAKSWWIKFHFWSNVMLLSDGSRAASCDSNTCQFIVMICLLKFVT